MEQSGDIGGKNMKKKADWEKIGAIAGVLSLLVAVFGFTIRCDICSHPEDPIYPEKQVIEEQMPEDDKEQKVQGEFEDNLIAVLSEGEYFTLGSYEQDGNQTNGPEPIEWRVLDVREDGSALVISKYSLDALAYNEEEDIITWEECTLRNWLNDDFYYSAFSSDERQKITISDVRNPDNTEYGKNGGSDTKDHIFCLNIDEAKTYFHGDSDRECALTKYARTNATRNDDDSSNVGAWWLRSPGSHGSYAAYVKKSGSINDAGNSVSYVRIAVRPAFVYDPNA